MDESIKDILDETCIPEFLKNIMYIGLKCCYLNVEEDNLYYEDLFFEFCSLVDANLSEKLYIAEEKHICMVDIDENSGLMMQDIYEYAKNQLIHEFACLNINLDMSKIPKNCPWDIDDIDCTFNDLIRIMKEKMENKEV